ncbi:MAG: mechanosensitive ion channel family protein, partial [Actinobacteria bacterium]|nr:mechanosensitive ion channel family protein [Actinomycetota bacterium]
EIELFTTSLDTFDNRRIILPNGSVFGATIENITYHPHRRVEVEISVEYRADIDVTRAALEHALATTAGVLSQPEPAVVLLGFGEAVVKWSVRGWAAGKDFGAVKQALIRSVKLQLEAAGVGVAVPRRQVQVAEPTPQATRRAA